MQKRLGVNLLVAACDKARLAKLATEIGVESRASLLDNGPTVDAALSDVFVVLKLRGTVHAHRRALMNAAIGTRTRYLDIAAEVIADI